MKKSTKLCSSSASSGLLKCALELDHAGAHTSKPPGKKIAQYGTWIVGDDGRFVVTTFSGKKKMAEWLEDAQPGRPQLCPSCGGVQCKPGDCLYALRAASPNLADKCPKCGYELGEHDGKKCPKAAKRASVALEDEPEADGSEPDDLDMRVLARSQREEREKHAAEIDAPTAIARIEEQPTLLSVERAREFLAKSCSVDEVRDVADKAKAVALYLRSRDASIDSQNDAAEIRMRAERRLGELTKEMPKAKGGQPHQATGRKVGLVETTYAEQGIDKRDASKWQALAAIPEKKFEKFVTDTKAKGERLTANAPLKMVRQEAKAKLADELRAKPVPQVTGRFDVIVIDPPWMYEKRAEDITQRGQIDYPPMELDAIKALPVAARAEDNCILWCWTTNAFMRPAFECLDAWGFTQKTILTWGKDRMGNGDWLRGKTEHCIMAVRGSPIVTLTNQTTLIVVAVREHSRKPDEFYELVESLCPGTKLDMFAREARDGFVLWGAETKKFATEAA